MEPCFVHYLYGCLLFSICEIENDCMYLMILMHHCKNASQAITPKVGFCITFTPKVMQKSQFWCDGPTRVFAVI